MNLPYDLIRYNGEIGPQYLDESEGKMKPLTKDVLQEIIAKEIRGNVEVKIAGNFAGLTLSDAPTQAENGNTFYAVSENDGDGQGYIFFNGQWREI